jgi:hypothetical protein
MFFFILFNINPCPPNQQMGFVWSTMIFKTILTLFLFFLKIILKGLKQPTSKAYKAWEMWESKVIISNASCCVYFMASNLTCEPCPSKTNKGTVTIQRVKKGIKLWKKIVKIG